MDPTGLEPRRLRDRLAWRRGKVRSGSWQPWSVHGHTSVIDRDGVSVGNRPTSCRSDGQSRRQQPIRCERWDCRTETSATATKGMLSIGLRRLTALAPRALDPSSRIFEFDPKRAAVGNRIGWRPLRKRAKVSAPVGTYQTAWESGSRGRRPAARRHRPRRRLRSARPAPARRSHVPRQFPSRR